jgi:hypothetical protein
MIVRKEAGGGMLLIGQTDHSRLVGQLAAHWGNDRFAVPDPYESVVRLATFHDFGWLRYETKPSYDAATGETPEFRKVPTTTRQLEGYAWAADWLLEDDPYAKLLVSKHRTGLWRGRYGAIKHPPHPDFKNLGAEIDAFIATSEAAQETAAGSLDARNLWGNYRLLQVWDLLGLYFCCQDPYEEHIEPVPVTYGDDRQEGVRLRMTPKGAGVVAFDPFPFDRRGCRIQLSYKRLPTATYASQAEFIAAYFKAETGLMQFELV